MNQGCKRQKLQKGRSSKKAEAAKRQDARRANRPKDGFDGGEAAVSSGEAAVSSGEAGAPCGRIFASCTDPQKHFPKRYPVF